MKKKTKKLVLAKETIKALDPKTLAEAGGGNNSTTAGGGGGSCCACPIIV